MPKDPLGPNWTPDPWKVTGSLWEQERQGLADRLRFRLDRSLYANLESSLYRGLDINLRFHLGRWAGRG